MNEFISDIYNLARKILSNILKFYIKKKKLRERKKERKKKKIIIIIVWFATYFINNSIKISTDINSVNKKIVKYYEVVKYCFFL